MVLRTFTEGLSAPDHGTPDPGHGAAPERTLWSGGHRTGGRTALPAEVSGRAPYEP